MSVKKYPVDEALREKALNDLSDSEKESMSLVEVESYISEYAEAYWRASNGEAIADIMADIESRHQETQTESEPTESEIETAETEVEPTVSNDTEDDSTGKRLKDALGETIVVKKAKSTTNKRINEVKGSIQVDDGSIFALSQKMFRRLFPKK